MTFEEFAGPFGSDDQIPDDKLYDFLQSIRPSLVAGYENDQGEAPGSRMGAEVRRRCQRDLFWMCRYFLWETMPEGAGQPISENLITEDPYRVVCDLFVKKDPSKPLKDQDEYKNRILLWPRGGLKSTIDICDTVQWILCFPHVRVFYITAEATLAQGFVDETKAHFKIHAGEPTLMNIFFPEFCLLEKDMGAMDQFRCPVYEAKHSGRKDPTNYATSVGKSQSGWHCEVLKGDDAVSNTNSENVEQCIKIRKGWVKSRKMMRSFGFDDKVGTRYDDEDLYGEYLNKNIGDIETTEGRNWTLMVNKTTKTKILIGKAITIKPEVREQLRIEGKPVTYNNAGEEGCVLLIPKIWPYSRLLYEYSLDEVIFEGQMNQDPRPPTSTPFTREMLVQNTVTFKEMPLRGPISHTWDMAFSTKKHRDYTTGSSVLWSEQGTAYVRNLVRDRFNPTEMAKAVVGMAAQDHPFIIGIEDAGGSRMIEPTIQQEAYKTGDPEVIAVCNRIDWIPVDHQKDAKRARMSVMHPWFMAGRLKLAKHLPYLEDAYKEIERCMLNTLHDDIPDVISRQLKYAPQIQREIQKKGIDSFSRQVDLGWHMIFDEEGVDFTTGRGYLLQHNPETGELEWAAQPIANPISIQIPKPEPVVHSEAPPGMECILGAGIYG